MRAAWSKQKLLRFHPWRGTMRSRIESVIVPNQRASPDAAVAKYMTANSHNKRSQAHPQSQRDCAPKPMVAAHLAATMG